MFKPEENVSKKYGKKDPLQHILDKPGMYIGSIDTDKHSTWVYDETNEQITWKTVEYSHGLLQIFREILMNAVDQSKRPEAKDMTFIKVSVNRDNGEIIVENDGEGIPVVIHEEHKVYIPEMLFSHFASSSNYNDDEERVVSGTNGLGAKATVVFSKYFKIETIDAIRKLKFSQIYKDNLRKKEPHKVVEYNGSGGTKIKFIPDYERFGTSLNQLDDLIAVIKKDVYDACLLTDERIKIYFNGGRQLGVKSMKDYVGLYLNKDTTCVYDEFVKGNYYWKWGVACNTTGIDGFRHVSFVNGVPTVDGGTHVDYVMKQISKGLVSGLKKDCRVSEADIRNHTFLFLIATVDKPVFGGQTKEKLTTKATKFGCSFEISDKFIKSVKTKTTILDSAMSHAEFKEKKQLEKTDGKRRSDVGKIPKLEDANWAGTKRSHECCLILTEGDSAKASVMSGINILGRNQYGVFPLKGKLLNVREKNISDIANNEEIQNIKKILGLQQNVIYNSSGSKEGLRYNKIMIITDADVDGTHIKGLIINYIGYFWPSLLECNDFITCMATPIIKTTRGKTTCEFYSHSDYTKWLEEHQNEKWETKYFKGLGTSTKKEFEAYCKDPKIINFKISKKKEEDIDAIGLAFDKKRASDRKKWLAEYDPNASIDFNKSELGYKEFIHNDLKHFSVADNARSIPSIMDGLKPSQRKILYAGFKRNLVKEIKVAQFAGYISETTSYHHGEVSLMGAIIGLAQDFIGSNNINLFTPSGQFGTRLKGGSDSASPRYIFTKLEDITRIIYNKNDFPLLNYIDDEGQLIEPVWYVPIIPMILVNGAEGIGTGYSCKIPNYNPKEIIENIRRKIVGKKAKDMIPWYKGFKGMIKKNPDGDGYITEGIYKIINKEKTTIEITELPIKTWTDKYVEYLDSLIYNKKEPKKGQIIKGYDKYNSDTEVRFVITLMRPFKDSDIASLKLNSKINTSNMFLYNPNNVIKKYDNVVKIIDDFYEIRLDFYKKRRKYLLNEMEQEMMELSNKAKFVLGIVNGEIIVNKKSKEKIIMQLEEQKFDRIASGTSSDVEHQRDINTGDYDYLIRMPIYSLTKEKIIELNDKLQKIKAIYDELRKKTPEELWLSDLDELEKYL